MVAAAVDGIDTVFHTAAVIELLGGASVTDEYRQRSFAVNVDGTKNLVHAAQAAGVKRFVYTVVQQCGDGRPSASPAVTRRCPTPTGSMTSTPRRKWSPSDLCCPRTGLTAC